MLKLEKLTNKEIKSIIRKIKERYSCEFDDNYNFFRNKEGKVYIVNKKFLKAKIKHKLNSIGIYFCKYEKDGIRLSMEGVVLIKNPKKNVIKLNKIQFESWMLGDDLKLGEGRGYVILEYDGFFIGCGKSKDGIILNYVPKARRMKDYKDF